MSKHLPPQKHKHVKRGKKTAARRVHSKKEEFKKANIYFLILAAALLGAMYFVPLEGWMMRLAYLVPFVAAGWKIIAEAFEELSDGNFLSEQLLATIAGIAAMAIGRGAAAVIIMLSCSACAIFRSYAELKKKRLLASIVSLCPREATLVRSGVYERVEVQEICVGDIISIAPGERIALDGDVVKGHSEIDAFAITGNSRSFAVAEGSSLISGCTNISEELLVKVSRDYTESTVCRMVSYIEEYEEFPPRQFRMVEQLSGIFTPAAVILAVLIAVLPPIFKGQWYEFISRGISLMAIGVPCTLFASVSLAHFGGIGRAVYAGALIKDANHLEALAMSETMVFARTGVLTEGKYRVGEVFPVDMDEESLLALAATAEAESKHPIALALRSAGSYIEAEEGEVREYISIPGKGVIAFFADSHVYVGNAALMDEHGIDWVTPTRPGTAVHVAVNNSYAGHIIVSDDIREGAFDAIEDLRVQGVKQSVLLTGGVRSASRKIAASLNFDMVKAELSPEAMVAAVEYLRASKNYGTSLAFVGKGVEDKELMECADLGISMGSFGDYEALEDADVVIMDEDIRALPYIRKIAVNAVGIAKLNILACVIIKLALAVVSVFGWLTPSIIVIIDCLASLALIINSFRTLNHI